MPSNFKVQVVPVHQRISAIQGQLTSPIAQERFHFYQNTERKLDVIRVPIELLVYRLENYRTRDTQLSEIAHGKFPPGFFDKSRQEDTATQQAQHDLLIEFAKSGKGEDVIPVWDELEKHPKQTDYLLIAANGVVVNGNRRLSAMRELYATGKEEFASFSHVNCSVLPAGATEDEILEVEIRLQMSPETKLPYSWITIARAARDLLDKKKTEEQVGTLMNLDPAQIRKEVAKLDVAELYLTEWKKKPNDYTLLDQTEQAFSQIATRNTSKGKKVEHQEITRAFDFFLIDNRGELETRVYNYINVIEGNHIKFLDQFAESQEINLLDKETDTGTQFEISLDDDVKPGEKDYQPLVKLLRDIQSDEKRSKDIAFEISAVCEAIAVETKNKNKAALKFTQGALKKLQRVDLLTADPATKGEISTVLQQVQEKAEQLLTALSSGH